eukprot:169266_1
MASSPYLTYQQTNVSYNWYQNTNAITRYYQLLAFNCINEMYQILYTIELEKQKVPANLQLIQSYVHLHLQKMIEFEQYIPFLPRSNPCVPYQPMINEQSHNKRIVPLNDCPALTSTYPTTQVHQHTAMMTASSDCTEEVTESQPLSSTVSTSPNNSDPISVSCLLSTQTEDTLQRCCSQPLPFMRSHPSMNHRTQSMFMSIPTTETPMAIIQVPSAVSAPYVYMNELVNQCRSIEDCVSISNITQSLRFYHNYQKDKIEQDDDEKQLELEDFFCSKYTNLINDYHHILQEHLDKDTVSNNRAFEAIHDKMSKYIDCDICSCKHYKRNERDRENQCNDDIPYSIAPMIDILDTIHCYFIHSFDTGYRIDATHHQQMIMDPEQQTSDENSDNLCHDVEMKRLKLYLYNKRKSLNEISGLSRRVKHYKFCTPNTSDRRKRDRRGKSHDESGCSLLSCADTDSIASLASLASIASTVHSYASCRSLSESSLRSSMNLDNMYSFGHRFYYWPYYKDKDEKDVWNSGYMFCDWYIDPKHSNLKEEILYNQIHTLSVDKYEVAKRKAQTLYRSCAIQSIQCDTHFFEDTYGIGKNDHMSMQHILCLILYTDFDVMCYEFSKTFRKKYHSETYQSLKQRNSEFANYSKLLREAIECFGQKMKNTQIKVFYHGVSRHLLNALVCRFCGPCSTTPQLEVAALFSKQDGIILELEKYSDNLRYFNCALLSCYGNEDERLFIGGFHPLCIRSVRQIQNGREVNYYYFIRALSVFNQAIEGKRHLRIETVRKKDYDIVHKLIKHQLASMSVIDVIEDEIYSNHFPDYINSCFNRLVQSKKKIQINLFWLRRAYPGFQKEFIDDDCPNLVRFDVLCAIFYCCTKVTVHMDQFDTDRNITVRCLKRLRQVLIRLNNIYHSRVRQISIQGTKQLFAKQELIKQKFIFNGCGWKLEVQTSLKKDESNLLLTNLNVKRSTLAYSRSRK